MDHGPCAVCGLPVTEDSPLWVSGYDFSERSPIHRTAKNPKEPRLTCFETSIGKSPEEAEEEAAKAQESAKQIARQSPKESPKIHAENQSSHFSLPKKQLLFIGMQPEVREQVRRGIHGEPLRALLETEEGIINSCQELAKQYDIDAKIVAEIVMNWRGQ